MKKRFYNFALEITVIFFRASRWFFRVLFISKVWGAAIRIIRSAYWRTLLKSCGNNVAFSKKLVIWSPEKLSVGDDVSFGEPLHICAGGEVLIGNRVIIGAFTSINSVTHDYTRHPMNKTLVRKKIAIEDDVWIGAGAIILPGVTIGHGAVVGAGSVVNKDIAPFNIVVGTPARPIKRREVIPDSINNENR